jgi:hypothetical protein
VRVARAARALLVPPAAVPHTSEGTVGWGARQGRAFRQPVSTGIETDTAVQIVSGVKAGDEVIVSGAEGLRPGAVVDAGQRAEFWILDFGFWIGSGKGVRSFEAFTVAGNPKSKIQNPKWDGPWL